MSVFTAIKPIREQPKVHYSQYIKTENKPEEAETTTAEPVNPEQPEAS